MALSAVKCSQGYFFTPPRDLQEQWGKGLRSGVADGEGGTAKGEGAGVGDGTAAVLDDTAADGKAKAGTGSLGGEIRGEYLVLVMLRDAGAVIFNNDVVEAVHGGVAHGNQ